MRYIIVTPTYTRRSAGIVTLHELQKWLVRYGKDAMILNFNAPYHVEDDDIVVYPEIVPGNPLNAKRVVRYILNVPGKIGGDTEYDKSEILVAYDPKLAHYSNGPILQTPVIEDFFTNRGYNRTIDCLWVGKGKNTNHPVNKSCVEITYTWPSKRRELAELLNRTRTLYSYDDFTMLLTEATLCGCEIKLIKNNQIVDYQSPPPSLEAFKEQLEQFIELTWYPEIDLNREAAKAIDASISLLLEERRQNDAASRYGAIQALADAGNHQEAIGELEKLLRETPDDAQAHNDLAVLHYRMGNKSRTLGHYEKAVRLCPENTTFRKNLASFYFVEMGWTDDAIAIYTDILKNHPADTEVLAALGIISNAVGRPEEAGIFFRRILEIEPRNELALQALAAVERHDAAGDPSSVGEETVEQLHHKAMKLAEDGMIEHAMADLNLILDRDEWSALAHNDLGVLHLRAGNTEQSIIHHEKAVSLAPDNATFGKNLASLYYSTAGRADDAIALYTRLLKDNPQDTDVLGALAIISMDSGCPDDALIFLDRVLDLEPANNDARNLADQLRGGRDPGFFVTAG